MTVGGLAPVALVKVTVSDDFLSVFMVSKTTKQVSIYFSKVDLHFMNAFDEIFGVNWRDQIREDFHRRAQSARRAVEMYETGRDIALIQDYDGQKYWVFVDELPKHDYEIVVDSSLPQAIDIDIRESGFESKLRAFADHDYDEDYLP